MKAHGSQAAGGVAFAVAAYASWGLLPIYWKALRAIPLLELLAHRVWLSALFALALLAVTGRMGVARDALAQPRACAALGASASLIALNWGLFIYTVERGDVLASSLGYFLNPLVNVALGVGVLRERLRPLQAGAVLVAAAGVAVLALSSDGLPWISLALAASFGLYGLLRKTVPVAPVASLAIETTLLAPLALGYAGWLVATGRSGLGHAAPTTLAWLAVSGVVTGLPLLAFAAAAQRLRLTTLGLFQYLAPTLHFAIAVGLYHETFAGPQLAVFGCVWAGLALYSADALRAGREAARAARSAGSPGSGRQVTGRDVHPSIEIS